MYECDLCGREFGTWHSLSSHLRWSDFYGSCRPEPPPPPPEPPVFCECCGRPFDTLYGYGIHIGWRNAIGHCYVPRKLYIPTWLPEWEVVNSA